jgi:hypothetical protein
MAPLFLCKGCGMLKREIGYEDFDGNPQTETFYFNLTMAEIIEYNVGYEGGLEGVIRRIITTSDHKGLVEEFKKIILMSYGERSEDGKRFVKSEESRQAFSQTAAYDSLFMQLATDSDALVAFITSVVPKDVAKEIAKQDKIVDIGLPPLPPPAA